jgi:hypothetical protein
LSDSAAAPHSVLPCAFGRPPASGTIRQLPEDFVVEEILGFEPDGIGGHMLLLVEKRGMRETYRNRALRILAPLLATAPRSLVISNRTVARAEELARLFAADGPIAGTQRMEFRGFEQGDSAGRRQGARTAGERGQAVPGEPVGGRCRRDPRVRLPRVNLGRWP